MAQQTVTAEDDLKTRCAEILAWRRTGIYEGTALQRMADKYPGMGDDALRHAELLTVAEALDAVAVTTVSP